MQLPFVKTMRQQTGIVFVRSVLRIKERNQRTGVNQGAFQDWRPGRFPADLAEVFAAFLTERLTPAAPATSR